MKSPALNEFTKEELEAALAKFLNRTVSRGRKCAWCGTDFQQNRAWQEFCTVKCKSAFHKNEKDRLIEALQSRLSNLERELDLYKRLWSRVPSDIRQHLEADEV
jgi:hypothetical protein